jgi:hypothetical protein
MIILEKLKKKRISWPKMGHKTQFNFLILFSQILKKKVQKRRFLSPKMNKKM